MRKSIISAIALLSLTACWDTGTGDKVGTIIRLNKQGVFCKTWEAEIIRGGMQGGSGNFGQIFYFTIESDELAEKVQKALDSQQEVKIYYRSEGNSFCRSDSDVFLTKIEKFHPAPILETPENKSDF